MHLACAYHPPNAQILGIIVRVWVDVHNESVSEFIYAQNMLIFVRF